MCSTVFYKQATPRQSDADEMKSRIRARKGYFALTIFSFTLLSFLTFFGFKGLGKAWKTSVVDLAGGQEQCNHFIAIAQPSHDSLVSDCYCEQPGGGRLGNKIIIVSNLITEAERLSCGVRLRDDMLSGWFPPENSLSMVHVRKESSHNVSMRKNNSCGSRNLHEWYAFRPPFSSKCHSRHLLRKYFNVNETHVLGKTCSSIEHVALHVRSGDITMGGWSEGGLYKPGIVHEAYGPVPTAFYISVMHEIRARRGNSVPFFVFCETMGNPTCEFFAKLILLNENVILRVGQPLIDDMRLMLCASEVAESHGTFQGVFDLSPKPQIRHSFSHTRHSETSCSKVWHWLASSEQAAKFRNVTTLWKNTGFQRHEVNEAYDMNHTEIVC